MGITLEKLDRPSIRALAEKHSAELKDIAQSSGNVYQAALDQQDRVTEFSGTLSEEDAIKFLNMYSEELNACSSKTNDETAAVLAEVKSSNRAATAIGGIIGLAVLSFIIFMVFR
ncbi:MAG: hypothetical protein WEB02_02730 [Methylophaga sp.]